MKNLKKLYADFLPDNENLLYVKTPEGNIVTFPGYDETHIPITIEDTFSHKNYIVIFDE